MPRDLMGLSATGLRVPLEGAFRRGDPSEKEEDQECSTMAQDTVKATITGHLLEAASSKL